MGSAVFLSPFALPAARWRQERAYARGRRQVRAPLSAGKYRRRVVRTALSGAKRKSPLRCTTLALSVGQNECLCPKGQVNSFGASAIQREDR